MLEASLPARVAREHCERVDNAHVEMAARGDDARLRDLPALLAASKARETRAIGTRLDGPLPQLTPQVDEPPKPRAPDVMTGEQGLTPRMMQTRMFSEDAGPSFTMAPATDRQEAADRLQRGALLQMREQKKQRSKAERLRALGIPCITPLPGSTPAAATRSCPPTPASMSSKVSMMSPLGQLIHRAQKLAQTGGQLRIDSSAPRSRTTPSASGSCAGAREAESRSRRRSRSSSVFTGASQTGSAATSGLPASIMEGLL